MNLENTKITSVKKDDELKNKEIIDTKGKEQLEWKLEIPKIELIADIAEGTNEEILDTYIGHFEETQKKNGNIGLAAHNRGYKVNFFNRLKELEVGDVILYTFEEETRIYKVTDIGIIEDTNWEVLKNTDYNKLTLITCVENKPSLRRCVQAIEN